MTKKFEDWLNEIEGFSLRMERIYDDVVVSKQHNVDRWQNVREYLKAAFEAGYEAAKNNEPINNH